MIIDSSLEFSDAQVLTATAVSTDSIDLGPSSKAFSAGDPLYLVVNTKVAPVGTGTYTVAIQTDDNSSFSSPTTIGTFIIPATAKAGDNLVTMLPFANERYVRLSYTLGGTSPAITVNALLSPHQPSTWRALPDAI